MKWFAGLFAKDKSKSKSNSEPESSNSEPELRYRDRIYGFVTFVIFFGGIVPFATQFLLPMIGSLIGKEINPYGAEVWNQFVSIALGIVATILSIVSMYLGFKNSDESRAIEKNIQSAISRLEDKLDDRIQEILAREHELLNAINETKSESKQKKSGDWDDQKKIIKVIIKILRTKRTSETTKRKQYKRWLNVCF